MIRARGRVVVGALVAALAVVLIVRVCVASAPLTPQQIVDACQADVASEYLVAREDVRDLETAGYGAIDAAWQAEFSPANMLKVTTAESFKVERESTKRAGQLYKMIGKCLTKLQRTGADVIYIQQVEELRVYPDYLAGGHVELIIRGFAADVVDRFDHN